MIHLSLEISVTGGLQKTSEVLATTRNRAVLPTLAAALRSSSATVRAEAVRGIVRRHDADSQRQLILHFKNLRKEQRTVLCQAHQAMPHRMAAALKAAVLGGDVALCENACQIIALCDDFDLFPALVLAAENRQHAHSATVVATVMHLANHLHDQLVAWSAGGDRPGRDPTFARRNVLAALERSLGQYLRHECREFIEAFLLLAPSDNRLLHKILHDSRHPCHSPIVYALTTSTATGTIARLVRLMCDTDLPEAALEAIAQRTDLEFVRLLLDELKRPAPLRVLHNMKRLQSVAWLEDHREQLLELEGRAQAVAVELAVASRIPQDALFRLLAFLLQEGLAEGRRASCQALAKFDGAEATDLVVAALQDPDEGVRAAAVRQLRRRNVPDALKLLVSLLGSRSIEIRDAARSSLAEFNFVRYRAMFDLLDDSAARTTGRLVHKVDDSAGDGLIEELNSPSVTVRLRGIEMAVAMEACQEICDQLVELTQHENVAVRREAVVALRNCRGPLVENALQSALQDAHSSVRDAAADALANLRPAGIVSQSVHAAMGDAP